jgi:hypothetical protein
MKRIDSHSFNNEVLAEINKVKTALTKITPENVKYFDDELLRKARGVVNYPDEYKWGGSMINSIDVLLIKRLTDKLKMSAHEYAVLDDCSSAHRILSLEGYEKPQTASIKYKVPDLFDGRNSFVKHFIGVIPTAEYSLISHRTDAYFINTVTKSSVNTSKNKTEITLDITIPWTKEEHPNGTVAPSYGLWFVRVYAFCWRKK